eukprot:TRINITY_DN8622_c0_g1_i1.p1 TRINITY_DN8622_c0_g1~~TRINITY_DN8622_c0_g1_i1.p1  ORF type:complete len:533 (+),score=124.13 TRINITY_DN8622_c0_g1_i1:135-1601(+)
MRRVHRLTDYSTITSARNKVAKFYKGYVDRDAYFHDAMMQTVAKQFAMMFNARNPPKKVDFIAATVVEFVERPSKDLACIEEMLQGEYRKHNNNCGFVSANERLTPQAFSHFTYEVSQHKMLVVDIQGVDDFYTDPQIHTVDGKGFGEGNTGQSGIQAFLDSHRCNPLCALLGLPPIKTKAGEPYRAHLMTATTQLPMDPHKVNEFVGMFEIQRAIAAHGGGITAMVSSGNTLYSASADCSIKSLDTVKLTFINDITQHKSTVKALCFLHNQLCSGSIDSTIKIWDASTMSLVTSIETKQDGVWSLCSDSHILCSGSSDGSIKVWNATNFVCASVLSDAHKNVVSSLLIHDSKLYSSSWDGFIKVWNVATWKLERSLQAHSEAISCMVIHGNYLISGSWDQTIKILNVDTFEEVAVLNGHIDMITSLAIEGDHLVSGSYDHTLRVWNLNTFKEVNQLELEGKHSAISLTFVRGYLFCGLSSGALLMMK